MVESERGGSGNLPFMTGGVLLECVETILEKHVGEGTVTNLRDNFLFGVRKYGRRTERIMRN